MVKKDIKNILFDLGGVLFHIDYHRTALRVLKAFKINGPFGVIHFSFG